MDSLSSTWLSPTPRDISRFIAMARSSSRSLSPERELAQMTAAGPAPSASHYGSPLYDRVTGVLLCPAEHIMRKMRRLDYVDPPGFEGVTCEFCGDTSWVTGGVLAEGSPEVFWHCEQCPFDTCDACAQEIAMNMQFHIVSLIADSTENGNDVAPAESRKRMREEADMKREDPADMTGFKWLLTIAEVETPVAARQIKEGLGYDGDAHYDAAANLLKLRFRNRAGAELARRDTSKSFGKVASVSNLA